MRITRDLNWLVALILVLATITWPTSGFAQQACYFSLAKQSEFRECSSFLPKLASRYLKAAREPILPANSAPTVFRLTIISAFNGVAIIRLGQDAKGSSVGKITWLSSRRGNDEILLKSQKSFHVTRRDFNELLNNAVNSSLWSQNQALRENSILGSDGSYWILEEELNGDYHMTHEFWPSSGPLFSIGKQILKLASVRLFDR